MARLPLWFVVTTTRWEDKGSAIYHIWWYDFIWDKLYYLVTPWHFNSTDENKSSILSWNLLYYEEETMSRLEESDYKWDCETNKNKNKRKQS